MIMSQQDEQDDEDIVGNEDAKIAENAEMD